MPIEIYKLERGEEKEWDAYVLKHPNSTFFHQIGWKRVVEKTYKHKPIYLIAREEGEVKGVLPLFLMRSMIFGKKLVSVPFAPYGGVCADDEMAEKMLIEEAIRIAEEYDVDYLEIRSLSKIVHGEYVTDLSYITFIINLNFGSELIWKNLRRDKKRGIKKAERANLAVEWNANIDDFYDIYIRTMRNLGTPVHCYNFFKNILNEFRDETKILTVKYEDIIICCKFLLFYKNTVISMWGVTLKEYQKFHPYDLANWKAIEYSCKEGYKYFDFGRCLLDSGVFHYKWGWSGEQKQLYYQFYLNNDRNPPDISQSNPNRKRFASVWKRLPVPLTKIVGPMLRRNFL